MAVNIVKLTDVPKRKRHAVPRIMQTADWAMVLLTMANGKLKPDEAIVFTMTPAELNQYKIKNVRAAARPIKQRIKEHGWPYVVTAKNTAEGGMIVIRSRPKE